ncbi:MAG: hypothetical protein FWF08_10020 [Oscillospiraceae bacterium]|nr:hypothetical protein [Oscillospiraceae bacterium]
MDKHEIRNKKSGDGLSAVKRNKAPANNAEASPGIDKNEPIPEAVSESAINPPAEQSDSAANNPDSRAL